MLAWRKTVCSLAMVFFAACSNSSMPNDGGNDDGSTMGDTHADTHTDVRHAGCRGATSCAS
jgi:hypothetical protein